MTYTVLIAAALTVFTPAFLFLAWKIGLKETSIAFGVAALIMAFVGSSVFFWDWILI